LELIISPRERTLKRIYLSRPPRGSSGLVAAVTLFVTAVASVAHWQDWGGLGDSWMATRENVFQDGQYWKLLSTIFIHADTGHFLGNALTLAILSYLLWGYFGFLIYPLAAYAFGMLANALTLLTYAPHSGILGASGVVYWMAGFWVTLYFAIDRRYSIAGRLLRCVGFSLAIFAPTSYDVGVAYLTHGLGFALGILFGVAYFFARRKYFRSTEYYVQEEEDLIGESGSGPGISN